MEEVGPIGETRGLTKGAHEYEARNGGLEACSVHFLLWQDTLGIVSRFFHVQMFINHGSSLRRSSLWVQIQE